MYDNILLKLSSSYPRPTPITTFKSLSYPLIVEFLALALTNLVLDLFNLVTNLNKACLANLQFIPVL